MKAAWKFRIAYPLAVFGGLATFIVYAYPEFPDLWFMDVALNAAIWLGIGLVIGWIVDRMRGVKGPPKASARVGAKGTSWYLEQIPKSAPLTDQIAMLAKFRDNRDISESDYLEAKRRLIGPPPQSAPVATSVTPAVTVDPASNAELRGVDVPRSPEPARGGTGDEHERLADDLRRIKALHDEGILTDEEYETKRKHLADRL
jgi:hypothetical protein